MPYDPIAKKEYDRKRNAKLKAEYLEKNPDYRNHKISKYEDDGGVKINSGGFDMVIKEFHETKPIKKKIKIKPEFVSPLEKGKPSDYYEEQQEYFNTPRISFFD